VIEEPSVSSDIRNRAEDENVISRARNSTVEVVRRLSLEYSKIANGKNANQIGIVEDNMTHWSAVLEGPAGSPYESGRFVLDLIFPPRYPFEPPKVTFRTPIFHPNVSTNGAICADILKPNGAWSPLMTVESLLVSIQSLLDDPNPSDPLNTEAATLFLQNRRLYDIKARRETETHAKTTCVPIPNREDPFAYLQQSSKGQVISEDDAYELAIRNSKRTT
jgi:ubiquitin-conjugating enzyme E2 D/E